MSNTIITSEEPKKTELRQAAPKEIRVVSDDGPLGFMLDTAKLEHCQRLATIMAKGSLVPSHLRGSTAEETIANCFRVINQALRWDVCPFQLADVSYVVKGRLGYEGKLVMAVINKQGKLKERLRFEYNDKKGDDLEITVIGQFKSEDVERQVKASVGQCKTKHCDMWNTDPRQKLIYTACIKWARAYCPEVILGIVTDDDLDVIDDSQTSFESLAAKAKEHLGRRKNMTNEQKSDDFQKKSQELKESIESNKKAIEASRKKQVEEESHGKGDDKKDEDHRQAPWRGALSRCTNEEQVVMLSEEWRSQINSDQYGLLMSECEAKVDSFKS